MTSGIYAINCGENGKVYIGSSVNCEQRLSAHFRSLRCGAHPNVHLQRAFTKYGEAEFQFTIQECHAKQRVEAEYVLIEQLVLEGREIFNLVRRPTGSPLQFSEETKQKQSESGLLNWTNNRDRILAKTQTLEANTKRSISHTGKKSTLPREHFINAAKRNWELHWEKLTEQVSEISNKNWKNPNYCANMSEKRKEMWQTQEHRDKVALTREINNSNAVHAELVKTQWKDPEYRAKNLEARKESGAYEKMIATRKANKLLRSQSVAKSTEAV